MATRTLTIVGSSTIATAVTVGGGVETLGGAYAPPPPRPGFSPFRTGRKSAVKHKQIVALSGSIEDAAKLTCLYGGVPSAIFDTLLKATRNPVSVPRVAVRPLGARSMQTSVPSWFMALRDNEYLLPVEYTKKYTVVQDDGVGGVGKFVGVHRSHRFSISLKGVELLQAVASKNKEFAAYVQAYMPPKRVKAITADLVLRKINNDKAK